MGIIDIPGIRLVISGQGDSRRRHLVWCPNHVYETRILELFLETLNVETEQRIFAQEGLVFAINVKMLLDASVIVLHVLGPVFGRGGYVKIQKGRLELGEREEKQIIRGIAAVIK